LAACPQTINGIARSKPAVLLHRPQPKPDCLYMYLSFF
jgi:hypothetical protein